MYINSISSASSNKEHNLQLKNKTVKNLSNKIASEEVNAKTEKSISLQEKRALEFLTQNHMLYDLNLALVICQLHNFKVIYTYFIKKNLFRNFLSSFLKAGMLFLYEKNGMYQRILQYHMENNEYMNILDTCKRFGTQESTLWIQALQYFSKREEVILQKI